MDVSKLESDVIMSQLGYIRYNFQAGTLSYDEAKEKSQPLLDEMNRRIEIIAGKHNKKPFRMTFTRFMR